MDLTILVAIAGSSIAMIGVVIAMMFWIREESNELRKDAKEDRKAILNLVNAIEKETRDFHIRLLQIENGRK